MEEKNTELLFTDENIMKALMKMSPENRRNMLAIEYNQLFYIANNSEYAQQCTEYFDRNVELSLKAKASIEEFINTLHSQTSEDTINEMVNIYKGLSREERLEFSKKVAGETTLENSLDILDYNWKNLISKFQKAVKV